MRSEQEQEQEKAGAQADPGDPRILTGEAWDRLCQTLAKSRALVLGPDVPDSPRSRAEGFRYLTRFLEAGIRSCVSHADPEHPIFGRMIEYTMTWGLDAPDCLYLYAPLRGDARYTISGNRGTANHIDLQVNAGHYATGDLASWTTVASLSGFELETDAEGFFELALVPAGARADVPNVLELSPEAGFILIRQYFDDWERERPADLLIECDDASWPVPPVRTDQIADQLDRLSMWMERGGAHWEKMSRGFLGLAPNTLIVHLPENADKRTGMAGQAYGMGNFRCAENEAVIVEFEPPECHHWSLSLASYYFESIDYATRQTSLNRHQSVLDADGVMRAVIAHRDPGVANWLDTAGHREGLFAARFLRAESAPTPRLRVVPFSDLANELPADTPRVDADTRARILTGRRRAVLRRYRA